MVAMVRNIEAALGGSALHTKKVENKRGKGGRTRVVEGIR
jgi:hypothetical protein